MWYLVYVLGRSICNTKNMSSLVNSTLWKLGNNFWPNVPWLLILVGLGWVSHITCLPFLFNPGKFGSGCLTWGLGFSLGIIVWPWLWVKPQELLTGCITCHKNTQCTFEYNGVWVFPAEVANSWKFQVFSSYSNYSRKKPKEPRITTGKRNPNPRRSKRISSRCSKDQSIEICFAHVLFATFPALGRIPVPQELSVRSHGDKISPQEVVGWISSLKLFKIQECVNSSIPKLQEYWLCKQRTYFSPLFQQIAEYLHCGEAGEAQAAFHRQSKVQFLPWLVGVFLIKSFANDKTFAFTSLFLVLWSLLIELILFFKNVDLYNSGSGKGSPQFWLHPEWSQAEMQMI